MKLQTVKVSVSYEIIGTLTIDLPIHLTPPEVKQLLELQLENEGFNDDKVGFDLKHRDYDIEILSIQHPKEERRK